ncbi:amino acid permease [Amycolatopsis thermophila]|uniref:Amino acid transporter n=1 Tax=Amycolatopsis thermophila TaxID=206084 RepID=A0ABU0F628_9PSEU|nr:amino acid permease [Amycolatopsis thermophila]MDQ0383044.1 amino acid transporter [Amycolatopsis thermophila]
MVLARERDAATPALPEESLGYVLKRILLGRPLITSRLHAERLSNPVALGVLSPDAISSSAYGTEEILLELLPYAGLAAFALVIPITGIILFILVLVTLSYRQVVVAYTRAGGSYIVARDNFGPRFAQVAAAALLIDYVVTVAVQTAAGTVAVASAVPALGPYHLEITIGIVALLCYVNLRGLREAGRPFAIPTYFFAGMVGLMIVVGVVRAALGSLSRYDPAQLPGTVAVHQGNGLVMGATVLVVLRAFANGGSSLTGVEAISNTVSAFRKPQGRNARLVLTVMASILGFLVAGVSFLAFVTHATPYADGYPSVLSQEARLVFGHGAVGTVLYGALQAASALILYTGANTSFNGFPFLASFVAEDRFLPRQLTRRGHRLVFSNGILVLAALSIALLLVTGGSVNGLVPFYAIGVFTGFAVAGFGMTRHHLRLREPGWRRRLAINLSAGVLATVVVGIFAVAKFTEGAWLIVVVFPVLVFVLIRLNREYRLEEAVLDRVRDDPARATNYARHQVFILVNTADLAVTETVRYARNLRGSEQTAVHFMLDRVHAERLQQRWQRLGLDLPLRIVDCPDRRLSRAAQKLVAEAAREHDTGVTVLLPRRTYSPVLGRLLHDRTADRIAKGVSQVDHAAATIVPFDVQRRIRRFFPELPEERVTAAVERLADRIAGTPAAADLAETPPPPPDVVPIAALREGRAATIAGRLHELRLVHTDHEPRLVGRLVDATGEVTVEFAPSARGLEVGRLLRVTGEVGAGDDGLVVHEARHRIQPEPGDET